MLNILYMDILPLIDFCSILVDTCDGHYTTNFDDIGLPPEHISAITDTSVNTELT